VIERARRQIGLFTSILMTVSTVVIALIIYTLTIDKMKEIATLKLIGAPDRTIVGLIVQQALAMGAIGFLFGTIFIALIKDNFPRRVLMQPEDALALGAVVMIVCLIASSLGVRLALKVDPATALGG
jgi:putative ABC transport system permease protein